MKEKYSGPRIMKTAETRNIDDEIDVENFTKTIPQAAKRRSLSINRDSNESEIKEIEEIEENIKILKDNNSESPNKSNPVNLYVL